MKNIPGLLVFNNAMATTAGKVRSVAKKPEAEKSAKLDFQLKLSEIYGANENAEFRAAVQENVASELRSFV